ncbi:hypothetical protein Dimus_008611 [Dionaea muscipula]
MKCRSIAGIWPEAPPPHRVTATAVLSEPTTLYTGAADGSIVWWSFAGDDESFKEIYPVAVLCGHAASIADLDICYPLLASSDGMMDHTTDVVTNCTGSEYVALISACVDGVLCVWSRGSGHCRRRRKLPPWVGSPSVVHQLPTNPRYVCIASSFGDASHTVDKDFVDPVGGPGVAADQELSRKHAKGAIIIVDSYTLTIIQTVLHGNLSIGPFKFMAIPEPFQDLKKLLLVDSIGQLQLIPLLRDSDVVVEPLTSNCSSNPKINNIENISEGELVLSIALSRSILGVLYRTNCVFMLVLSGTVLGGISFNNSALPSGSDSAESHPVGCIFLHGRDADTLGAGEAHGCITAEFAVWNNRGSAIVYRLSYFDNVFKSLVLYEIPSVCCSSDIGISITCIQLNDCIIRLESICFNEEEPLFWKPHITVWSLPKQNNEHENVMKRCKLIGEGDFLVDWIDINHKPNGRAMEDSFVGSAVGLKTALVAHGKSILSKGSVDSLPKNDLRYVFQRTECVVSCSMVLLRSSHMPHAIVYGYQNGEIELVKFQMHLGDADFVDQDVCHDLKHYEAKQHFSGHTGAILCLAAHQMVGTSAGQSLNHVLLSGSMDCTVRIWDLQCGILTMVMHHHVAPVRQLILPPIQTDRPWNDCFLSVGEDFCVALVSLDTMRVERMFGGHPNYPAKVVWDGERGYLACLSQNHSVASSKKDVLYIWDIKAGSLDRILHGSAACSMYDYFYRGKRMNGIHRSTLSSTSASSLVLSLTDDGGFLHFQQRINENQPSSYLADPILSQRGVFQGSLSDAGSALFHDMLPVKCCCPLSGIAVLSFDLASLMSFIVAEIDDGKQQKTFHDELGTQTQRRIAKDGSNVGRNSPYLTRRPRLHKDFAMSLLQFSLSFLHSWDMDFELDKCLESEMKLNKPEKFIVAPGLEGDRGSVTLAFPGFRSALELWKSSSEFCAMRSLTLVSLAQRSVSLSPSCSTSSSALSAFYTRNFAEKYPHLKPPSLQLLVSFWQDEEDHVRMAARSLFYCAASRAIPSPLFCPKVLGPMNGMSSSDEVRENVEQYEGKNALYVDGEMLPETRASSEDKDNKILEWMGSYELQDWISCVGGTSQDAMASHIIVAAALAIWYPSLVKSNVAMLAVNPLIKLVMSMNEKYSSTAAELLAEGMESTWKPCIGSEIHRLISDIFFQIECVSGASANTPATSQPVPPKIRDILVGVLLPSLALADIPGFLTIIEGLIWSTSSDSPAHLVSLKTLIRVVRGSPRSLAEYLNKAVNFILQTVDPSNLVMRRTCLQSSMRALKEVVRVYPMVALNEMSTRLAVGDAISEINCASIHVYDMQSVTKMKILDASGPPGLPSLLTGTSETVTTAISVLSFSPDGEGLVAFSEHGLIIRWWSLGSAWWEKLSRNLVPVQCTKLIFVPPWEGFLPNSSRASVMAKITGNANTDAKEDTAGLMNDAGNVNTLIHNLDLSYGLEWIAEHQVLLTRQGHTIGSFQF